MLRRAITTGAITLLVCAGCGHAHKVNHEAENEAMLASIEVYPGAKRNTADSMVVEPKHGETPPSPTYTTTREYILARASTCAAALEWYRSLLRRQGWRLLELEPQLDRFGRGRTRASTSCFTSESSATMRTGLSLTVSSGGWSDVHP